MSDSSRVQLAYIVESAWGTTPASALTSLRYTSESLGRRIENLRSDEVRSDRQVTDLIRVGSSGSGGTQHELSYQSFDPFFEAAFASTYSGVSSVTAANITAAASGNQFTAPSGLPVFSPGQWIKVSGFATAANNGYFQVVSSSGTALVVENGAASLVNEAAGPSVTIKGNSLTNGVASRSFTIEKFFSDVSLYWPFKGQRLNTLTVELASRAKVTIATEFMGIGGAFANMTAGTGAYGAATTTPIMSASNNVARLYENGAVLPAGVAVKSMRLNFSNNLRVQDAVGNIDPIGIGYGRFTLTGELQAYFQSETIFNRYANGTDSGLSFILTEGETAYIFTLPAIEYTNGDVLGVGNDQDVLISMEFEAKRHATQGIMCRLDSFAT